MDLCSTCKCMIHLCLTLSDELLRVVYTVIGLCNHPNSCYIQSEARLLERCIQSGDLSVHTALDIIGTCQLQRRVGVLEGFATKLHHVSKLTWKFQWICYNSVFPTPLPSHLCCMTSQANPISDHELVLWMHYPQPTYITITGISIANGMARYATEAIFVILALHYAKKPLSPL